MTTESAVQFASDSRVHIGLQVGNLEQSLRFYRALLEAEPTKIRPGYAKFETENPPVNLSLNAGSTAPAGGAHHHGVQVKSTGAVVEAAARLERVGASTRMEEGTACCYAVQTKVWAQDPDGNSWEVFVVLQADTERHSDPPSRCCTEGAC